MKKSNLSIELRTNQMIQVIAILFAGVITRSAGAEDWGAYALIPVSAPAMVLETVGPGTDEGAVVSIGRPAGTANQKWIVIPKADNLYSIKPSAS